MWRKNITKRIEISGTTLQGTGMYLNASVVYESLEFNG